MEGGNLGGRASLSVPVAWWLALWGPSREDTVESLPLCDCCLGLELGPGPPSVNRCGGNS